jgi:hypothetical protein
VYFNDVNCLAKLTSFVLHSQNYVPTGTGSSPFSTWLAGDSAIFVGANSNDLVNVKVVSQLSSPILSTDTISYTFTVIKQASNSVSTIIPSPTAIPLTVAGRDAPNFKINTGDALFTDLVYTGPSTGAGVFTFKLTCVMSAMTVGANVSYNSFCPSSVANGTLAGGAAGVDVGASSNFSYKLIQDPNNNGTLTLAQAQSAFSSGDSTVTLLTDLLSGSTGFTTSALIGPVSIVTNPKIILVLQAKDPNHASDPTYSSFEYFPMTVQTFSP